MSEEHHTDSNPERGTPRVPRFFFVGLGVVFGLALLGAGIAGLLASGESDDSADPAPVAATDEEAAPYTPDGEPDTAVDIPESAGASVTPEEPAGEQATVSKQEMAPAATGSTLKVLDTMPASTVGLIPLPGGFETARFELGFSPYGWGPGGPAGGSLVVTVDSMEPLAGDTEAIDDYTGKNVSAWVIPEDAELLATGGRYAATAEVRKQGDIGSLFLSDISEK